MEHLPPDDIPDDVCADAKQHREWGVRVIEAVQQNFHNLPAVLLFHPPVIISSVQKACG